MSAESTSRLMSKAPPPAYRGRLAPSPTGFLHLGHARTFWIAQERAREQGGVLVLRNEDMDDTGNKFRLLRGTLDGIVFLCVAQEISHAFCGK